MHENLGLGTRLKERLHTQFAGSLTSVHGIGSGSYSINNNDRIN